MGSLFLNFAGGSDDCVTVSLLEDDILESDQQFSAILSSANARVDVSETVIVITNTNSKYRTYYSMVLESLCL